MPYERQRIELDFYQKFMIRLDSHLGYFHIKKNRIIPGAELYIRLVSQTRFSSTLAEGAWS